MMGEGRHVMEREDMRWEGKTCDGEGRHVMGRRHMEGEETYEGGGVPFHLYQSMYIMKVVA